MRSRLTKEEAAATGDIELIHSVLTDSWRPKHGMDDIGTICQLVNSTVTHPFALFLVFTKGYKKLLGRVISDEYPFKFKEAELKKQYDVVYHVNNIEGQTWAGWTSNKGLPR